MRTSAAIDAPRTGDLLADMSAIDVPDAIMFTSCCDHRRDSAPTRWRCFARRAPSDANRTSAPSRQIGTTHIDDPWPTETLGHRCPGCGAACEWTNSLPKLTIWTGDKGSPCPSVDATRSRPDSQEGRYSPSWCLRSQQACRRCSRSIEGWRGVAGGARSQTCFRWGWGSAKLPMPCSEVMESQQRVAILVQAFRRHRGHRGFRSS